MVEVAVPAGWFLDVTASIVPLNAEARRRLRTDGNSPGVLSVRRVLLRRSSPRAKTHHRPNLVPDDCRHRGP